MTRSANCSQGLAQSRGKLLASTHQLQHQRQRSPRRPQRLNLVTARFALNAPLAEVLAVIMKDLIPILTHTRACATNDFHAVKRGLPPPPCPDAPASSELRERYFFNWTPEKAMRQPGIVHDPAVSDVDPMM